MEPEKEGQQTKKRPRSSLRPVSGNVPAVGAADVVPGPHHHPHARHYPHPHAPTPSHHLQLAVPPSKRHCAGTPAVLPPVWVPPPGWQPRPPPPPPPVDSHHLQLAVPPSKRHCAGTPAVLPPVWVPPPGWQPRPPPPPPPVDSHHLQLAVPPSKRHCAGTPAVLPPVWVPPPGWQPRPPPPPPPVDLHRSAWALKKIVSPSPPSPPTLSVAHVELRMRERTAGAAAGDPLGLAQAGSRLVAQRQMRMRERAAAKWQTAFAPVTNLTYNYNTETRETTYDRPACLVKVESQEHIMHYREAEMLNSKKAVAKKVALLEKAIKRAEEREVPHWVATEMLNSKKAVAEKVALLEKAIKRAEEREVRHREATDAATEKLNSNTAVAEAVKRAEEREEEAQKMIEKLTGDRLHAESIKSVASTSTVPDNSPVMKIYHRAIPPDKKLDRKTYSCRVFPLDDAEMTDHFDFSPKGMFARVDKHATYNREPVKAVYGGRDLPPTSTNPGRVLYMHLASRDPADEDVAVMPCYQVQLPPGGGLPPVAPGAPAPPPVTAMITTDRAEALLSNYFPFAAFSGIGYHRHQALLEIDENQLRIWLAAHFAGPGVEATQDGVQIGVAHFAMHPHPAGPPAAPTPIILRWMHNWMVMDIGQYPRTICSPIFTFGLLYPTVVDAHNMGDSHSNNLRIGWSEDGGLNWQMHGTHQRTTMGVDNLARYVKNNPGIFGAKEVLELSVVVKVVPFRSNP